MGVRGARVGDVGLEQGRGLVGPQGGHSGVELRQQLAGASCREPKASAAAAAGLRVVPAKALWRLSQATPVVRLVAGGAVARRGRGEARRRRDPKDGEAVWLAGREQLEGWRAHRWRGLAGFLRVLPLVLSRGEHWGDRRGRRRP